VDAPTFVQAVAQATVAVSREENRPVLTGVRIQFDGDKVVMTSTDRFRLSRSSFSWTPQSVDMQTVTLVRGSLLRDVSRALDEHQNVVIDFDAESPSLLGFENAGRVSTSQLIDGEFPAIDRLFADEYPTQAVIDKQALIGAIKRVALVAERNAPIRMEFNGQELLLSAGSADESQAREILDVDLDGEEITVAFNPAYLIEGLSAITEPFVRMKMTTAVKPVEFNGQQEADSDESMDYRYLLVPMRYNN
jgi:DNA polymerase-3 subunit beta